MQCKEVVREWIERAEEDFGFATSSLELEKYFAQICFHFQQAASAAKYITYERAPVRPQLQKNIRR
jgi:HEPN domain-containing protein